MWTIIYIAIIVLTIASLWVLFEKAGKPGWAAIIPIYNFIVLIQIIEKPIWWILLFLIPLINFVILVIIWIGFAKVFGKDTIYAIGIFLLPFIFLPLLAFSKDTKFIGVQQDVAK